MSATLERWRLPGLILLAILCAGCNIITLPWFLIERIRGTDSRSPPQLMKLTADDKGKEVKVVILAHQGVETRPQFITADQELSGLLAMHLQRSFKADKQKAVVVPSAQVKKYKDDHPDWQMDLHETGKHFNADYVIDLEIQSLSLYEKGSASQLYRGRADIEVSVLDLHHPDEAPVQKFYHGEYPNGRPIPVEDRNPLEFRQAFLDDIAQHISWYFVPHQIEAEFASDM